MDDNDFINSVIMNINEPISKSKSDFKCAPGREYEAGSCISLFVLEEMAKAYNNMGQNKIKLSENVKILNPTKYKIYLVHELGSRIGDKCTDQKCWSKQDFIKNMNRAALIELKKFTHRPNSQQGKFDWLATFDINDTMEQYERKYKGFKFFGAVPMDFAELNYYSKINNADYDEMYKNGIDKIGIIFNLDEHYKPGSHWVAMFTDLKKGHIYYFDSAVNSKYGVIGEPDKRVKELMKKQVKYLTSVRKLDLNKDIVIKYNQVKHQKKNTECGVYSINFLIRMARGDEFDIVSKKAISDDLINKCRKVYFDKHSKEKSNT